MFCVVKTLPQIGHVNFVVGMLPSGPDLGGRWMADSERSEVERIVAPSSLEGSISFPKISPNEKVSPLLKVYVIGFC
jgi:hypothetical protein